VWVKAIGKGSGERIAGTRNDARGNFAQRPAKSQTLDCHSGLG